MFDIPAELPTPILSGGLTRVLTCLRCKHAAQYHTKDLVRYEEP
jgi:hypothetical protein